MYVGIKTNLGLDVSRYSRLHSVIAFVTLYDFEGWIRGRDTLETAIDHDTDIAIFIKSKQIGLELRVPGHDVND